MPRPISEAGVNPGAQMLSRRELLKKGIKAGAAVTGVAVFAEALAKQQGSNIARAGQLESATVFAPGIEHTPGIEPTAEWVDNVRIKSREEAVELFGIEGTPSADINLWEINKDGGAHYKGVDGKVTRVRSNGAVVDAWIEIQRKGKHQAQSIVANPLDVDEVDVNQATLWKAKQGQERALWEKIREEHKDVEERTQPDVATLPLCKPLPETHNPVTPRKVSLKQIIKRHAGDAYTRDRRNWKRVESGWQLIPDPAGFHHRLRLERSVLRGWMQIDRLDGTDALAVVATHVKAIDVMGGTLYVPKKGELRDLFYQVEGQLQEEEATNPDQKGVLVIPVCN